MSNFDADKCFEVALELAKTAGEVIKNAVHKVKNIETKSSPKDLVTETDKQVEELLMKSFALKFPDHKFIGEESVSAGVKCELTDDPTWIIDPVDGTMNFVHTFPYFCVSIALWVNKKPEIGIIYNPLLDQMYTAQRGKGAFLNNKRIHVSGQKDLSQALIFTELGSSRNEEKMKVVLNNLTKIMDLAHGVKVQGTAALDMCAVGVGYCDAYYQMGLHCWDMAAGCVIVREAGGVVVDMSGEPFDVLSRRVICASSKEVADQLVSILEIFEEERD
ncbi:UNVERIFIED_CONTAM: hypothetical protein RMT77_016356 [Armadillidium vulgare]